MVRQLLSVALLTFVVGACSSTPIDTNGEQIASVDDSASGSLSIPLTTSSGDGFYRLNLATFTITGPALAGKPRVVKPLADTPVHTEVLPLGTYSIQLEKGWVLEKRGTDGKTFTAVSAQLVTSNPLSFEVTGKTVADAFFGFVTTSGDVAFGSGSVDIRIGVQDCKAYDSYTAALAELTAECQGTVDPRLYSVSKDGLLTPAFDKCPNDSTGTVLRKIRQLLSIQQRTARLPFAKQCLAGRFDVAQAKFAASGVKSCGVWKKARIVNEITAEVLAKVEAELPRLPAQDTGRPLPVLELLKENSFYDVSPGADPGACKTGAECAAICASAFPGFVLSGEGNTVLTDPIAWLLDTTYKSKAADPFLRATYYHPMSYYGPLPGVLFGDYSRFEPCGPNSADPLCGPEQCSYFAGTHLKTFLQKDCLDPANLDTCVSFCGSKLP
ncbi:MAG: hypothetical protein EOO73_05060 [Myxococcales bacterium]|nr:MAG: hypothetical protein EOO73_05060 [Myxococcales bacterium]